MQKQYTKKQLSANSIIHLSQFLTLEEIFISLNSLNSDFKNKITQKSGEIIKLKLIENLGINEQQLEKCYLFTLYIEEQIYKMKNKQPNYANSLIKSIFSSSIPYQETLNVYGYKSDGGIFEGDLNFWIDKVFMENSGMICSKAGQDPKNYNIQGVIQDKTKLTNCQQAFIQENLQELQILGAALKYQFGDTDLEDLNEIIKQNQNLEDYLIFNLTQVYSRSQNLYNYYIKVMNRYLYEQYELHIDPLITQNLVQENQKIKEDGKKRQFINFTKKDQQQVQKVIQYQYLGEDQQLKQSQIQEEQKMEEENQIQQHSQQYILKQYNIEEIINKDYLDQQFTVLKSFNIYRNQVTFTCPLKTCALFTSFEEIGLQNSFIVNQFDSITEETQLTQLILQNKINISKTNIPSLQNNFQQNQKFIMDDKIDYQYIKYVIFNNNNNHLQNHKNGFVHPIAWIQFNSLDIFQQEFYIPNSRFFSGKFYLLKAIDSIFKKEEESYSIDLKYVQLKGFHFYYDQYNKDQQEQQTTQQQQQQQQYQHQQPMQLQQIQQKY